jgi:hypothetical protein
VLGVGASPIQHSCANPQRPPCWKVRSRLSSLLSSAPAPVLNHFAVHRDGYKPVRPGILELHYRVSCTCELSPAAWLRGILLNRLIFPTVHCEVHGSQVLPARALGFGILHQLSGYGSQEVGIKHGYPSTELWARAGRSWPGCARRSRLRSQCRRQQREMACRPSERDSEQPGLPPR